MLVASDNGVPSRTSQLAIQVQVLDVNDNPPRCSETTFHFNVAENAREGSKVGVVTAVDQDEGLNARLTYALSPLSEARWVGWDEFWWVGMGFGGLEWVGVGWGGLG